MRIKVRSGISNYTGLYLGFVFVFYFTRIYSNFRIINNGLWKVIWKV